MKSVEPVLIFDRDLFGGIENYSAEGLSPVHGQKRVNMLCRQVDVLSASGKEG